MPDYYFWKMIRNYLGKKEDKPKVRAIQYVIDEIVLEIELILPSVRNQSLNEQLLLYNEGVYWFLYPLIQNLRDNHGKYIELYDDTFFSGGELDLLLRLIANAKSLTSTQPSTWMQETTMRMTRCRWEQVKKSEIIRADLESWLSDLELLTDKAIENNGVIFFSGN